MKIGLISDTHDAFLELRSAIQFFKDNHVEAIVHAGDFTSAEIVKELMSSGISLFGVLGNMDSEIKNISKGTIKEPPYYLVLGNKSFLVIHDLTTINVEKESNVVDVIVFGNTHKPEIDKKNRALLINPGEGCGINTGKPTVALLDLDTMKAEIHELEATY